MANLDALLKDDEAEAPGPAEKPAPAKKKDIDALLADEPAQAVAAKPLPALTPEQREAKIKELQEYSKPKELPWYERAAQGFIDPIMGAGQVIQNVTPDAVLNAGRKITDPILNAVLPGEDRDTSSTSTKEYNELVRRQEAGYQAKRENAGQDGVDWARIAGTVANPVSWYTPLKGGSTISAAVKAGAKAGAFQGFLQPVTSEGSFFWDKGMQTALGGAIGGTLGGAFAGLAPIFGKAKDVLGKWYRGANPSTQAAAATQYTDDAFRAAGADPAQVDPIVYRAMRDEVEDATKLGATPDPTVMTNRADAAALPIPIDVPRWMAARDGFQYSWAWNKARRAGGEDFAQNIATVNRGLIENLDQLGAKNALEPYDFGQLAIQKLKEVDEGLAAQVNAAYSGVRNSAGQSAALDGRAFASKVFDGLKATQTAEFLPAEIRNTLNALRRGAAPLTVDTAQQLDKIWGNSLAKANAAKDGNTATAIRAARNALMDANLVDDVGQQSMALYQQAKALAKQRFDLHDANPAMNSVVEGNAIPDDFFQKYLVNSPVSEIGGLKQLLGDDLVKQAQNTAVRGLKKAAIGNSSPENASFSQANFNNAIHNDARSPRLRALFSDVPETLSSLYRVGRVAENAFKFPQVNSANVSQSSNAAANMIDEALASATSQAGPLGGLLQFGRDYVTKRAEGEAIRAAATPGVTKEPLRRIPSKTQARLSDLLSRSGGAAVPQDEE